MHIDISYWLSQLNLSQYQPLFQRFHGVQDILDMDERTMRDEIGVKNSADRSKIMGSLILLRSKAGQRMRSQPVMRYSTSFADNAVAQKRSSQQSTPSHQLSASVQDVSRMEIIANGSLTEAEKIRRQLEWELSQDGRRLESHAWYHGSIPRAHAENVLKREGQFLVRDSSSGQPGDLVLSLFWRGTHLHFIISKVVRQPHTVYESIQYRLEDEPFDSVSDLVTFYVGSGRAISAATGAKITTPVNRTQPLSLYSSRYGRPPPSSGNGAIYSGQNPLAMRLARGAEYSTQSLPRPGADKALRRRPSDPSLVDAPPQKPSRVPSKYYPQQDQDPAEQDEQRDFVPVQLLSVHQSATLPRFRRSKTLEDRPKSVTRDSFLDRHSSCDLEVETTFSHSPARSSDHVRQLFSRPFPSLYDLDNFQTLLLPGTENKPLEMKALEVMSLLFDAHSPKAIALHLLHDDLDVLGGFPDPNKERTFFRYQEYYRDRGVTSGIELCTLPNGEQLRQDLLERTHCLRLFVAVTILTCPSLEDRADMLNQWIQVAIESKTALGNVFGFVGLMCGLFQPQIQRLTATWALLRQRHTSTAYTFEARLRPQAKAEVVPHAPNTTIPDLHSAILLWEASLDAFMDEECGVTIPRLDNLQLGSSGPDFGLDLLASHMDLIRSWSLNLPLYLRNSRKAFEDACLDEILVDVFRTEFHMKFLWGSRSASAATREQRYSKFDQVLTALSQRCEPSSPTVE